MVKQYNTTELKRDLRKIRRHNWELFASRIKEYIKGCKTINNT
jgi:hypothetical protein